MWLQLVAHGAWGCPPQASRGGYQLPVSGQSGQAAAAMGRRGPGGTSLVQQDAQQEALCVAGQGHPPCTVLGRQSLDNGGPSQESVGSGPEVYVYGRWAASQRGRASDRAQKCTYLGVGSSPAAGRAWGRAQKCVGLGVGSGLQVCVGARWPITARQIRASDRVQKSACGIEGGSLRRRPQPIRARQIRALDD